MNMEEAIRWFNSAYDENQYETEEPDYINEYGVIAISYHADDCNPRLELYTEAVFIEWIEHARSLHEESNADSEYDDELDKVSCLYETEPCQITG